MPANPASPPTTYQINIPSHHPPYENPIDGRFPLHFDTSPEMKNCHNEAGDSIVSTFTKDFGAKWHELIDDMEPPLQAYLEVRVCITGAARAATAYGEEPECSPPFFAVKVSEIRGHDMRRVVGGLRGLIEEEFPESRFPECYPDGGLVIRFFAMGEGTVFG